MGALDSDYVFVNLWRRLSSARCRTRRSTTWSDGFAGGSYLISLSVETWPMLTRFSLTR
jgi:hypothetical protein